jgi:hypothetical protein
VCYRFCYQTNAGVGGEGKGLKDYSKGLKNY